MAGDPASRRALHIVGFATVSVLCAVMLTSLRLVAAFSAPAELAVRQAALPVVVRSAHPHPQATRAPATPRPAPSTVAGYSALFNSVDPAQWGAADVAVSVRISGGREVWLWGDTFETTRFVHSTAIVQTGGSLHVSHGGAQLLPNDSPTLIYWINRAGWADGLLAVYARQVQLTGRGVWDFRDTGHGRTFWLRVTAAGDLDLVRTGSLIASPPPDPGPLYGHTPGRLEYQRRAHPDIRLADGDYLVTISQNWDDGRRHPMRTYRPIFGQT